MATMLVDTHLNDPEQSTPLLLPFTVVLLDHLSLFVSQMRVVAAAYVANPTMFVRRHGFIMHPWRQSGFPAWKWVQSVQLHLRMARDDFTEVGAAVSCHRRADVTGLQPNGTGV